MWGLGLHNSESILKGLVQFGKVKINLDKLYYNNVLVVKNNKGGNIQGFVNASVSDKFVELIMKYIKKQEVKQTEFKNLNSNEQNIYNELIYLGGFHKDFAHNSDNTISELKERLTIIEGEIEAGNNNKDLLTELQKNL